MSHSSRCQRSAVHQSPEVRQGPARSSTLPRTPSAMTKLGWLEAMATRAARRGRKRRRARWVAGARPRGGAGDLPHEWMRGAGGRGGGGGVGGRGGGGGGGGVPPP